MNTENFKETPGETGKIIEEVGNGIYQIYMPTSDYQAVPISHINVYLLEGMQGWFMIDTGWYTPRSMMVMEAALKSLNLTFTDIKTILVTHCHPDHFGLAGRIKHLSSKTRVMMHRWEADLAISRYVKFSEPQEMMSLFLASHGVPLNLVDELENAFMPALEYVTLTLPDRMLYSGDIINTGNHILEVIWTPGHSPGHICLYEHQRHLLFSGDNVLPNISSNIAYHILSGDNPLGDYISALGKLSHLSIDMVYPGHEYPFTDLKGRVKKILDHHQKRENDIFKLLDGEKLLSTYEMATQVAWEMRGLKFDEFHPVHQRMAITETISHLEHMRWNGKVVKVIKGDHVFYRQSSYADTQ